MTKKVTLKINKKPCGTAYLLDDKTFEMNISQWDVGAIYDCLKKEEINRKQSVATEWNKMAFRIAAFKDCTTAPSVAYIFRDSELQEQVIEAFGENVLRDCVIIRFNVRETVSRLTNTEHMTDCDWYRSMVADKFKDRMDCDSPFDFIIVPFSYLKAIPRDVKGFYGSKAKAIDLEFYNSEDKCLLRLRSGCYHNNASLNGEYSRCKAPAKEKVYKTKKYMLESEIPVMEDCGCIDCKDSEYHIENGVYLRCTLCGKEVKESEYDGEHYPEYCNRHIAKKIRAYEEMKSKYA